MRRLGWRSRELPGGAPLELRWGSLTGQQGGGTLGVVEEGTLGAAAGGTPGAEVGLALGAGGGVGSSTLGSVAGVCTLVGGSLEWGGRNSLVGTKVGSLRGSMTVYSHLPNSALIKNMASSWALKVIVDRSCRSQVRMERVWVIWSATVRNVWVR